MMKQLSCKSPLVTLVMMLALAVVVGTSIVPERFSGRVSASSHMDAPGVTLDDAANTTDVYAFVSGGEGPAKTLSLALAVYPHEEPGIGPNRYVFDDDVRYEIHVATGNDVQRGEATFTYRFDFTTRIKNQNTILQNYTGVIQNVDDAAQNLTQTYTVTRTASGRTDSTPTSTRSLTC
jgi:hypothetical protein